MSNQLITSISSIPGINDHYSNTSGTLKQGVFIKKNPLETSGSRSALPKKQEQRPGFQPIPGEDGRSPLVQKIQALTREKLIEMSEPRLVPRKSPRLPTDQEGQAVLASQLL